MEKRYIGSNCYIVLSDGAKLVRADGCVQVPLTPTEYKILLTFIDNIDKPITREELAKVLWGVNYDADDKNPININAHFTHIRRKLNEISPELKNRLHTNDGFGSYIFKKDPENKRNYIDINLGLNSHTPGISEQAHPALITSGSPASTSCEQLPLSEIDLREKAQEGFRKIRVTPFSHKNYIPRPELIVSLREKHRKERLVFIRGLPGTGKSELARQYADESYFENVLSLELGNDGTGSWEQLIEEIELSGVIVNEKIELEEKKKSLLEKAGSETLIILDNFNSAENASLLSELVRRTGDSKILVTSELGSEVLNEVIAGEIIDLEQETDAQKAAFCTKVFCSYSGITILNDSVFEICALIGNHPLTASLLGTQLRKNLKFGDTAEELLCNLRTSMYDALSHDNLLRIRLDQKQEELIGNSYDILRCVFRNVLAIDFFAPNMRRQRQVLGALILLPSKYHHAEQVVELVGDSEHCREARNAIIWLEEAGILNIAINNRLVLHPLLRFIFSEPSLGDKEGNTIAELSGNFLFHLLRNGFVSKNKDLTRLPNTFPWSLTRKYNITFDGIENDLDSGWIIRWNRLDDYSADDFLRLKTAINNNHSAMGIPTRVKVVDLKEFLVLEPPRFEPKHNGLFFCLEHEDGRSLWLFDYTTKKSWCILNCSQQRDAEFRYFEGKTICNQNSKMKWAEFDGFIWEKAPGVLCFPETVCNVPVTKIKNALGDKRMHFVCFPPTVEEVEKGAFRDSPHLICVIFTGDKGTIGDGAFQGCPDLSLAVLPRNPSYIGGFAFSNCPNLRTVAVADGTRSKAYNITSSWIDLANISDDKGLYYQGQYAYKIRELLLADEDKEVLDLSKVKPIDYLQFLVDVKASMEDIQLMNLSSEWVEFRFGRDVVLDAEGVLFARHDFLKEVGRDKIIAGLQFPFDSSCKIQIYEKQPIPTIMAPVGWRDVWAFLILCIKYANRDFIAGNIAEAENHLLIVKSVLDNRQEFFTENQRKKLVSQCSLLYEAISEIKQNH